jgi:ubiquinone/menaquinone biosynthesis C-methylase UbiE
MVQVERSHASLPEETDLGGLELPPEARALNAGCGTGAAARELAVRFPQARVEACDLSELRLRQAEKEGAGAVRYFQSPLSKIDRPHSHYDFVFCRDGLSLIGDPRRAAKELYRVLKRGGKARVVEYDGLLLNLFPASPELRRMLELLEKRGPDLRIGRKLPELLSSVGFRDVTWEVSAVRFDGAALSTESKATEQRLAFAMPLLKGAFGTHARAEEFRGLYLAEMKRPGAVLFYNKFRVHGWK